MTDSFLTDGPVYIACCQHCVGCSVDNTDRHDGPCTIGDCQASSGPNLAARIAHVYADVTAARSSRSSSAERPLLLDLYSCAGCIARGYSRSGFDAFGIDHQPQPRYPYGFHRGDAIHVLARLLAGEAIDFEWGWTVQSLTLADFAAAHASPPCQAHSDLQKQNKLDYLDFIAPTRWLLAATGLPYVIENVDGAPLIDPVMLCGSMFPETRVYRHRLFETNWPLAVPEHQPHRELTFTHDKRKAHYGQPLDLATMRVQVTGGGNAPVWAKAEAMGLADAGLTGKELNEGVPPAYGEWVGSQLLQHVSGQRAA